ncbi:2OG-Fe(II) oxygenase family protein [Candidatus Pelagibacter communis]|uniref:2OG-Fe(II) oxygenase family protein n=1 Tax=Pelagibacter ubique TaxID=198252 RepID=UPI00065B40DA|nr:2OG-Fe(II) oxygenase family protein [Candidatus Pelagibacter ubique]
MELKYQNIKVFGPPVFRVKIPMEILDKLNKYIDDVVKDKSQSKNLNYGESLVGDVTQEFVLEKEFAKSSGWLDFLANCTKSYIEINERKKISKFALIETWIVRQFENEYNPTHWHSGHVSGAGFLKVPKNLGKHVQDKKSKKYRGGDLQLIHGSKMFMSASTLNIIPEIGDFYIFPNYLMHTVFPFKETDEERRSISFNALIDEEIYNVYGK